MKTKRTLAKSNQPNGLNNIFRGLVILGVLVVGVLVTNSLLKQPQDIRQEAAGSNSGTVTLTNPPIHYHDIAKFNFTFEKQPQTPNFAVVCSQNGARVFVSESKYVDYQYSSQSKSGTLSFLMDNTSNTNGSFLQLGLVYTIPADCIAYFIEEGTRNGKMSSIISGTVTSFTVTP